MTVAAQDTLKHLSEDVLSDPSNKRWLIDQLVRYYNRVQRLIAIYRPDALLWTGTMTLMDGTRQSIPRGYLRLLEVMGNDSGVPCSMPDGGTAVMDAQFPGWRNAPASDDIEHVWFDPRDPRSFQNYPPAGPNALLVVKLVKDIVDIDEPGANKTYADVTGDMSLVDDFLAEPLTNGIAFLCYARDSQNSANAARASAHMQMFEKVLGLEISSALAEGPHTDNAAPAAPTSSGVVR